MKSHLSQISSSLSWSDVEKEMEALMEKDPERYPTENDAVDDAVIRASDNKVTQTEIDQFKSDYDHFAWTITLAPADDPKIAVVSLLVQGGTSYNAGFINREIIGEYLQVNEDSSTIDFSTKMQ